MDHGAGVRDELAEAVGWEATMCFMGDSGLVAWRRGPESES